MTCRSNSTQSRQRTGDDDDDLWPAWEGTTTWMMWFAPSACGHPLNCETDERHDPGQDAGPHEQQAEAGRRAGDTVGDPHRSRGGALPRPPEHPVEVIS